MELKTGNKAKVLLQDYRQQYLNLKIEAWYVFMGGINLNYVGDQEDWR